MVRLIYDWLGPRTGRNCLVLDEIVEGPAAGRVFCSRAAFQSLPVGWFGGDCRGEGHSGWPGWSVLLPLAVGCSVVHPQIGILAIVAYSDEGNT